MPKLLKQISSYFIGIVVIIFSLYTIFHYFSAVLFTEPLSDEFLLNNIVLVALLFVIVLIFATDFFIFPIKKYNKYCYPTISLYTMIPRIIIFIKLFNLKPTGDFNTYHIIASALSQNTITLQRYISIFPHVIGYPTFLSIFYRIFGSNPYIGQFINIILSIFISILIYKIGKFIYSDKVGFLASLIWSFFPSQMLYASLLCTEYLYTFLFLLAIYLFLKRKNIYFYIIVSFICVLLNAVRPLGIILIITFFIYDIVFSDKIKLKKFLCLFLMIIIYVFSQKIISMSISHLIKLNVATKPIGFNLFVGMNYNNKGTWNTYDSGIFNNISSNESKSADEVQLEFKDLAMKRVDDIIDQDVLLKHIKRKHEKMWMTDNEAVQYIKSSYKEDNKTMNYNAEKLLTLLSNIFYYASIIAMILGLFFYLKNQNYYLSIPIIIIIGTILAHILVEVGGRYHFSCIPLFLLIGAYGIVNFLENIIFGSFIKNKLKKRNGH